jgi:hypothetical protein
MSYIYLVNWDDKEDDDAMEIVNDTPYGAYRQFLDENESRPIAVKVCVKGEFISKKFDEHFDKPPENMESANQDVSPTDQTQQEILSQLKQINWAIRIGFAFIAAVVAGIIKPGIFG